MSERLQGYQDIQNYASQEIASSSLVLRAKNKLQSLPLQQIKEAGIRRDRSTYFLNIAYPSMQAMNDVTAAEVVSSNTKTKGNTVALYTHVPFCTAECYYCHYYKKFDQSQGHIDEYLDGIERELEIQERRFGGLKAASVYIGGGTPSYMNAEQINKLFISIKSHVTIPPGTEISFEMHPESVTDDRLAVLEKYGVNRINIGVESFTDVLLAHENRRHTSADAVAAFQRVRAAGFRNINLDLIYGLKGQTVSMWEESLDQIAKLKPESTTMYYLRLKRGTPEYKLWKKDFSAFPTNYELFLMHAMSFERMEGELGYTQNPTDWFIKDSSFFHTYQDHNWRKTDETDLLGIGPSAYSYVGGWQYYNVNDTEKWQNVLKRGELPIWKGEHLIGDEPMRRTVMLGIKMDIDRPTFIKTYGTDVVNAFSGTWEELANLGLVEINPEFIGLTYVGKLFADEVGQQFYSDAMKRRMAAVNPELISTTWPQFNP